MSKIYIIAEAGVNHNNKISLAYKLINIAKKLEQMRLSSKFLRLKTMFQKMPHWRNIKKKILIIKINFI